jgi:hypothetical protein
MTTDQLTVRTAAQTRVLPSPALRPDQTPRDEPRRPGRRPWVEWLLSLCTYLPLAALGFMPVWLHWSSQMNGCNCWDQLLLEWFVNWLPASVAHGHNVLVTNFLYAPGGVNLMWNNAVFAIGAVAAPLTETIGVVHTFAILLTISLALSASTMFLLLRRWTAWLPAAWLGGLVYGFSTLAIEETGPGRINAAFDAIPPLVVIVILKLIRKEWSPTKGGFILGLLLTIQLFISEEMLTITLAFVGTTLVVLALIHWAEVLRRVVEIVRAAVAAAFTFLVLSAYPLYVEFFGPDRITGPPQPRAQLDLFSSDVASLVTPSVTQWLTFAWADRLSGHFSAASAAEVTEYIGLPLLALLVATVLLLRRRTIVRIFALVGLAGLACSLGPYILVANHNTHVPGPDYVLQHLPVVGYGMPSRYALVVWFSAAVVFALGLEAVRDWVKRPVDAFVEGRSQSRAQVPSRAEINRRRRLKGRLAGGLALLLGVAAVIPLIPNWPYHEQPADVPAFFTSGAVQSVPPGSLAVTYPYPITSSAQPMIWQADAGMRFRMLGGYAIVPDKNGTGSPFGDASPLEYCLLSIYDSDTAPNWLCAPWWVAQWVRRLGVTSVIAGDGQQNVQLAVRVFSSAFHVRPRQVDGVWLWRCTQLQEGASCRWS